jgi:hypothetical protein
MTLIELIVGLAIASLMTITGWRAIESLQSARDQTINDASRWRAIDTFFASLEADLRRAELTAFNGANNVLTMRIPSDGAAAQPDTVRYVITADETTGAFNMTREAVSGALTFAQVRSASFAYRAATTQGTVNANDGFIDTIGTYPRAVEITLAVIDNTGRDESTPPRTIKRLMVLR